MVARVSYAIVFVSDMKRSVSFYRDVISIFGGRNSTRGSDNREETGMKGPILSRNADVKGFAVTSIEGEPMKGALHVKPLIRGNTMQLLELRYTAGVGAHMHTHSHESIVYVVKGKVKSTVGNEVHTLGPGDACRHPEGVLHGIESLEESIVVEIKSPAPDLGKVLGIAG